MFIGTSPTVSEFASSGAHGAVACSPSAVSHSILDDGQRHRVVKREVLFGSLHHPTSLAPERVDGAEKAAFTGNLEALRRPHGSDMVRTEPNHCGWTKTTC
ncbi:unnamed protein product [Heligmosomoides polygyrus]|uniref:Uncharacterized protein n=1 Tax=Heligmosomoides polygyrus TaxID=6339 RepID=A0A183GN80_HELPZ|nr:unnamed protein product [Heligmosomoides polygyrus]